MNYDITNNDFYKNDKAFNFSMTDSIGLGENFVETNEALLLLNDTSIKRWSFYYNNDSTARPFFEGDMIRWPDSIKKAGKPLSIPDTTYAGRKNILVTEWGPYDFRYPLIWNTNPSVNQTQWNLNYWAQKENGAYYHWWVVIFHM